MKARAFAPVNLALIKYWGKNDEKLRLPINSNLSVCLSNLGTVTQVEFKEELKTDKVWLDKKKANKKETERVREHLDRIRELAGSRLKAEVRSENNFFKSVGLSSSASGLAALSLAGSRAAGLRLSERELSRLARLGSGSACRSIPDGWVEWQKGKDDKSSVAVSLKGKDYWDIRILVVMLAQKEKRVSSTDGQVLAKTSPFYIERIKGMEAKLKAIKEVIKKKDFRSLGEKVEEECLNMHSIMLTSKPSLIYWLPETVRVMQAIQAWREQGLESYFTVNTGQSVFSLCLPKDEDRLAKKLEKIEGVVEVKRERIGNGARLLA